MKARITFNRKPVFNFPRSLVWPGQVEGMPERTGWSVVFVPEVQLEERVFEGDLRWLVEPVEEGLQVGTSFSIGVMGNIVCTGTVIT